MIASARNSRPPSTRRAPLGEGADLAIANEQVGELGGTERVLAALLERYPQAHVLAPRFGAASAPPRPDEPDWVPRVVEIARGGRKRHHLSPLYARWFAAAPVGRPRVVLSLVHGGWGAAVSVPPGARHVAYSAGLPRALYGMAAHYRRAYPPLARPLLRAAEPALRLYDRRLMRRPDRLLTNSKRSAAELERVHGRRAEVVYPPVDTRFFTPSEAERRHFLAVARLGPQKRIDVLIEAFRELDERLIVAGCGPWLERLRSNAPGNVSFTGFVPDDQLRRLYRQSHAVICPSVEEFGIVMAEAQACGTPVIAPREGGALEVVEGAAGGILVDRVDARSVAAAVRAVRERRFDPATLRVSAERFSVERFVERIGAVVAEERELALAAEPVPATGR
jgi:glycosyltransferase involved in cell wall biosynthesis